MSSQYQELVGLLSQLMNTNNEIRRNAEQQYEGFCQQQTTLMLTMLLEVFTNQQENVILRTFATILIRRLIDVFYSTLAADFLNSFRERLVASWRNESNLGLSLKLTHVIAQLSFQMAWSEALPTLLPLTGHDSVSAIKTLSLLEVYVDYCPEDISTHYQMIGAFLANFFGAEDFRVRLLGAKATAAVIAALESDEARNAFRPALQSIQSVMEIALQKGDEIDVTKLIEYLVIVAQSQPLFFKSSFDSITQFMLRLCKETDLEVSTRTMALELIITISESAPALARRSPGFVENAISIMIQFVLEVDEDEMMWKNGKYDDDSLDEDAVIGEEAIERFSNGLGGKSVTDIILKVVQTFSSQSEWKYRRAAVAAVCRLAEGTTKYFRNYLAQVCQFLLASLQDSSVRVQYEAMQTIGRFAALYHDELSALVDKFLPTLAGLMQDANNCPKIRGHAASALINLLHPEDVDTEVVEKYLEPLLQSLIITFQTAPNEIKSPCLSILGCVAQACPEGFAPYYDQFMPGIKNILMEATSTELVELRGKAMECAGLLGDAVGGERFARDAIEIMRLFFSIMNMDADVTFEYILPACARIAKAIKHDFLQYLPLIYPPLLAGANQEIQFSFEDADDDEKVGEMSRDEDTGIESAVISLAGGSRKRITLNTHSIQQKTQATQVVYELSEALGSLLGDYILPTIESLYALTVEKHSTDIRYSAALSLSKLFSALLEVIRSGRLSATTANVSEIFHKSLLYLMEALKNEPDHAARFAQAEAIRDLLDAVYLSGVEEVDGNRKQGYVIPTFPETLTKQIVSFLLMECAECLIRRNKVQESIAGNEALDQEDKLQQQEERVEEEDEVLTVLIDIFGHLIKLHQDPSSSGNSFMGVFDQTIAPAFSTYLSADQPISMQRMICCLLDDVIEFGGDASFKYIPSILPVYLMNSQSEDHLLKQCCMYGLAMMVYKAPQTLLSTQIVTSSSSSNASNYIAPMVSCFVTTILHPEAFEEDNIGITENAVFGLVNFLTNPIYRDELQTSVAQHFPLLDIYGLVLKKLPLKSDAVEVKITTIGLCSLIESNDPLLFTKHPVNHEFVFVPEILRIFGDVLSHNQSSGKGAVEASPLSITAVGDVNNNNSILPAVTQQRMLMILSQFQQAQMISKGKVQEFPLHVQSVLRHYCQ